MPLLAGDATARPTVALAGLISESVVGEQRGEGGGNLAAR